MEKIKSRWRKIYFEGDNGEAKGTTNNNSNHDQHNSTTPPEFEILKENVYLDKTRNERHKKDRSMVCDCILTKEERARGVMGCLDNCLNRMLMIECGPKCNLGDHCLNKKFQKSQSASVEVFKTKKKGWGLRATTDLPSNSFVMEYVGEVIGSKEFRRRVKKYTKQKVKHHYFMALSSEEIIDATVKGNQTRFINHSCEPNCETQKWTVNSDLRIGFFTIRNLQAGEEITFDYQFQRYGRKAQKCYCEAPACRGYIESVSRTNKKSCPVDLTLEDKINALAEGASQGLKTKDQVIALASLSIKAENVCERKKLLDIIKTTKSEISLRLFVDYHGLEILSLWMRDPQADCDFKATIIETLGKLPIPNKLKVLESNVYRMIEKWATESTPEIKALASKLLKKFQALSPGFKIPRLNRLQRMEMEKKMEEDGVSSQKKPLASVNYFKPQNNNTTTTNNSSSNNNSNNNKRRFDSMTGNNIDLTPKISKEEHRQQFELHVRLKDYYDTIEKYYGSATVEQLKLSQRAYTFMNCLPPPPALPPQALQQSQTLSTPQQQALTPQVLTAQTLSATPQTLTTQQALTAQALPAQVLTTQALPPPQQQQPLPSPLAAYSQVAGHNLAYINATPTPTTNHHHHHHHHNQLTLATYQRETYSNNSNDGLAGIGSGVVGGMVVEANGVVVNSSPTNLIVLANNSIEPAHAIDDELAFSLCDYDEYYSTRDKVLSVEDVIGDLYPLPGSYYTTPNGETWFATVTLDRKTHKPRTVILDLSISDRVVQNFWPRLHCADSVKRRRFLQGSAELYRFE